MKRAIQNFRNFRNFSWGFLIANLTVPRNVSFLDVFTKSRTKNAQFFQIYLRQNVLRILFEYERIRTQTLFNNCFDFGCNIRGSKSNQLKLFSWWLIFEIKKLMFLVRCGSLLKNSKVKLKRFCSRFLINWLSTSAKIRPILLF